MGIRSLLVALLLACVLTPATAQRAPRLEGTWRAKTPDGPQTVIVRSDSSASFGDETVRWRIVADSIFIALGDEWMVYNFVVAGRKLTLSGGDLEEPVVLDRVGPAPARPDTVPLPSAPPMHRRATAPGDTP
ncbi:MAG: hypothetical protein OER21_03275 [Gemmatimonadota bacterium]|nr:hypothetical protein [Gemmatimonadota bacterium]